jgi:hypothetical protein
MTAPGCQKFVGWDKPGSAGAGPPLTVCLQIAFAEGPQEGEPALSHSV